MTLSKQTPSRVFFASDHHFGHENILKHMPRPFDSIEEMGEALIADWNTIVTPQDRVFVLGDFSFYGPERTSAILSSLHGQKTLIKGNHDSSKTNAKVRGWNRVLTYHEEKIDGERIILSHFPFLVWNQQHRGAYHLHGHSHGSCRYPPKLKDARILDVGVDNLFKYTETYAPMEWSQLRQILCNRTQVVSYDQHDPQPYSGHESAWPT